MKLPWNSHSICVILFGIISLLNHPAAMQKLSVQYHVIENFKINQLIGDLGEVLRSKGMNVPGEPTNFEVLLRGNNRRKYFDVNKSTGQITLVSHLDREEVCEKGAIVCEIKLTVEARNDLFFDVKIVIDDENDKKPVFSKMEKWINIPESVLPGKSFPLPVAKDDDGPDNGVIRYTMAAIKSETYSMKTAGHISDLSVVKKYFQVITKNEAGRLMPELKIIRTIDREEINEFVFVIVAEDRAALSASITIYVKVIDVNDNGPVWKNEPYRKNIKECIREKEIFRLLAEDKDDSASTNGQVSYHISDRSPYAQTIRQMFYISSDKLYLTDIGFRNHNKKRISFFVTASDGPGLTSDTEVTLDIIDCNDQAPVITINNRSAIVLENNPGIHMLSRVTVKDMDRGQNSDFSCKLNDTKRLQLKKTVDNRDQTGGSNWIIYKIETEPDKSFDREIMPKYSIKIECIDRGDPPQNSSEVFTVTVLDVNDNDPVFTKSYTGFTIKENMQPSTYIGKIQATDRDSGVNGAIVYELNAEGRKHFSIGPYGEIQALNKFDREERDSYEFVVIAKDKGKPSRNATTTVRVTILDVNDCKPVFSENYIFDVVESHQQMHIYKVLGKLKATDADLGNSGEVSFHINRHFNSSGLLRGSRYHASRNQKHNFHIDKSGRLSITGIVDREVNDVLYVEVVAKDGGLPVPLSTTTVVTVQVLDLNDNAPQFRFPNATRNWINVSLDSSAGTILGAIDAFDPDEGANGTVRYKIMGGDHVKALFELNSDGKLILAQRLDPRQIGRGGPERLNIQAVDRGRPKPLTNYTILLLQYTRDPNGAGGSKDSNNQVDYTDIAANSDSLTILYILAAVVFIVFVVVLSVLIYLYFRSRKLRARGKADAWNLKNRRISGPTLSQRGYGSEDYGHAGDMVQDTIKMKSGIDPQASSVCVFNDQESSYTHLAMTNARAASYGYIPVMRGEGHYATYSPYTERRRRLASGSNSLDGVLDSRGGGGGGGNPKEDNSYEHCQWSLSNGGESTGLKSTSASKVPLNSTAARMGTLGKQTQSAGRFATIGGVSSENLAGGRPSVIGYTTRENRNNTYGTSAGDAFGGGKKPGSTNLQNANSYAFLQNFSEEDHDNSNNIDNISDSKPSLDMTGFKSSLKTSPYVTSSFV